MGANNRKGPIRTSRAYRALVALADCGAMIESDWMAMSSFEQPRSQFSRDVVQMLVRWKLVQQHGNEYRIVEAGLRYIGKLPEAADPGAPTPGRYVRPMQPLSAKNRPTQRPSRPGAYDYRDIPSRHANESVPFKSSIKLETEQG